MGKQLRRTKREVREDKPERVDKDAVLRERISPTAEADESRISNNPTEQDEQDFTG